MQKIRWTLQQDDFFFRKTNIRNNQARGTAAHKEVMNVDL